MTSGTSDVGGSWRSRIGLPRTAGHRNLAAAATVDSLGSGMLLTFVVVYFARTTELSLPLIGGAITLARLLALPTAVLVGPLADRFGPRRVALAGNVVSAFGYTGFLVVGPAWQVVVVTLLTQVGAVTYWTNSTGLVALAADGDDRTRWFAMLHMLRNAGLGLGGALGALLVGVDGTTGLRILVAANVVSYLVAALLLARWRPVERPREPAATDPDEPAIGYRTVLRDRRYMLLVTINVAFVLAALVLSLLLGVYVVEGLHTGAWIAGVLLVVNSVQVALTQTTISNVLVRYQATRVILSACLLNAAAFGLFAVVLAVPSELVVAVLLLATVVYSFAESAATPFAETLSVGLAPERMRGRYLAVYQLSWNLGQVAAPALLTTLLAAAAWLPWVVLAAVSVAAVPGVLVLERSIGSVSPAAARTVPDMAT